MFDLIRSYRSFVNYLTGSSNVIFVRNEFDDGVQSVFQSEFAREVGEVYRSGSDPLDEIQRTELSDGVE